VAGKIIWSPHAVNNLEDICNYIERDSHYYASIFAQRVVQKIQALVISRNPEGLYLSIRMILFGRSFKAIIELSTEFTRSRLRSWQLFMVHG